MPKNLVSHRLHWDAAHESAEAMLRAAETCNVSGLEVAANNLDQSLAKLWALRADRDIDWQTILNHAQGMMCQFFREKRAGMLTEKQCQSIVKLIKNCLGPSTKTVDDLNEAVRLIEDAGFDPFLAISGDPMERTGP